MRRYDPTFVIQQEPPNRVGQVVSISPQFLGNVRFNGRQHRCWAATADTFAPNEDVTFVSVGEQSRTFLKKAGGYPTRWPMRLKDWGTKRINNVFLRYILERNTRHYTYEKGLVVSVVSTTTLSVTCRDGRTRTLPVEYMGEEQPAYAFDPGDQCLIYSRSPGERVVIGFIDQEPKDMAHLDELGPWFPVSSRSSPYGGVTFVLSATDGTPRYKIRHYVAAKTFYETPEHSLSTPFTWPGPVAFCHQRPPVAPEKYDVPDTVFAYNLDGIGSWQFSLDFGSTWNTIPRPGVTAGAWYDYLGRMADDYGNPILQFCWGAEEWIPDLGAGVPAWGWRVWLANIQQSGSYTTVSQLFGPSAYWVRPTTFNPDPAGLSLFHCDYGDGITPPFSMISPFTEFDYHYPAYYSYGSFRAETPNGLPGTWVGMSAGLWAALCLYRGTTPGECALQIVGVPSECYMIRGALANAVGTVDVLFQTPGPIMKIRRVAIDGTSRYWEHQKMAGNTVYCMAAMGDGRSFYGMYLNGNGKILSIPRAAGA